MFEGSIWQKKLKTDQVKVKNFLKNEVSLQKIGSSSDIAENKFYNFKFKFYNWKCFVIDGGQKTFNAEKFNLKDKFALITGAGGLLGNEHAHSLLECGANIILTDINTKNLIKLFKFKSTI